MKETITIENFGGIKKAVIPLSSINIFIGKQASGKSVTAKLIYFFKGIISEILYESIQDKTEKEINAKIVEKFATYFPEEAWADCSFYLTYKFDNGSIAIEKYDKKGLRLSYSPKIKKLFTFAKDLENQRKEEQEQKAMLLPLNGLFNAYYQHVEETLGNHLSKRQIFVPAGRSFFANLQDNIFSLLSTNQTIDPFLIEFGSFYERMKGAFETPKHIIDTYNNHTRAVSTLEDKLIAEILVGKYVKEDKKDYIIHDDKRKINVSFSSSGQQETLPLLVVLKALTRILMNETGAVTYIEEPEAHLFPSAQKRIIEFISAIYNNAGIPVQFVITTHSPYILTSFKNLLQAGQLLQKGANKKKLFKIVPEFEILKPGDLNAYAFQDDGVTSLIDEETGLISAELLDKVSEEIAIQFDELLEL